MFVDLEKACKRKHSEVFLYYSPNVAGSIPTLDKRSCDDHSCFLCLSVIISVTKYILDSF